MDSHVYIIEKYNGNANFMSKRNDVKLLLQKNQVCSCSLKTVDDGYQSMSSKNLIQLSFSTLEFRYIGDI